MWIWILTVVYLRGRGANFFLQKSNFFSMFLIRNQQKKVFAFFFKLGNAHRYSKRKTGGEIKQVRKQVSRKKGQRQFHMRTDWQVQGTEGGGRFPGDGGDSPISQILSSASTGWVWWFLRPGGVPPPKAHIFGGLIWSEKSFGASPPKWAKNRGNPWL